MAVSRRIAVAFISLFTTFAMLLALVPAAAAATTYDIDAQGWLDADHSSFQVCAQANGGGCATLADNTPVSVGDTVRLEIAFKVGNDTAIQAGDRLTYDLPANLQFHDIGVQAFKDSSGRTRATWTIRNGKAIIEFSEDAGTELSGYVTVDGQVTKDSGAATGGGSIGGFCGLGRWCGARSHGTRRGYRSRGQWRGCLRGRRCCRSGCGECRGCASRTGEVPLHQLRFRGQPAGASAVLRDIKFGHMATYPIRRKPGIPPTFHQGYRTIPSQKISLNEGCPGNGAIRADCQTDALCHCLPD
ncbi:Ig-like domain-containing protein [Bifidobacterium cuniculi]|nr:Ig-like domain-containing protein [Bifidobacterium cuniculi]